MRLGVLYVTTACCGAILRLTCMLTDCCVRGLWLSVIVRDSSLCVVTSCVKRLGLAMAVERVRNQVKRACPSLA